MQRTSDYELKAQARRLKDALAEMRVPVTHSAALNLVARVHGSRRWEELLGQPVAEPADVEVAPTRLWLLRLEASLRLLGYSEEDLDDAVHEIMCGEEAASTNNQGVFEQLRVLYNDSAADGRTTAVDPKLAFVHQLAELFDLDVRSSPEGLALPMLPANVDNQWRYGIRAEVTTCEGSPVERQGEFDALEWFVAHSVEEVLKLVKAGLSNTYLSDEVALWTEKHSAVTEMRELLSCMLHDMRTQTARNPSFVGVTVRIDEEDARKYVEEVLQQPWPL